MQDARLELKLSQKDVAQKINEREIVLRDYEAGKAVPSPQILGKLERVLAVKLRGESGYSYLYRYLMSHRLRHWEEVGGAEEIVIP